jgi:phage terminase large subunit-like protein
MSPARRATSRDLPDPELRWRPRDRTGRECQRVHNGQVCGRRGAHYCKPRADVVVGFFRDLLVHTRGVFAGERFVLEPWQEMEIVRPLFGEVQWSQEFARYVRRYRIAYMIMARKNGKSELAAGIQLYMLLGDGEAMAEVYSAATDTKQAGMVFEPALRMTQLSAELRAKVQLYRNTRRLIVKYGPDTKVTGGSFYEVLTSDAAGELGRNPHSFNLDEVLALPDGSMWNAMTSAAGTRAQELLFATTTETNVSASFGAELIDEAERIQEDPSRAPHALAFVRKLPADEAGVERLRRLFPDHPHLPVSADPWDEANWHWPNPALDGFLSREALRRGVVDSRGNLSKENAWLQFHANKRVQQATRYISLDQWDACVGDLALTPDWWTARLAGRRCWAGLDLSAKLDMTAWCLVFDKGETIWRFWVPETVVPSLTESTGGAFGNWVRDGWITATEGDTIDYEVILAAVREDAARYSIARITYDKWSGEPVRQRIVAETGLEVVESATTYERMTAPMTEALRLLAAGEMTHGGNPVARWMADNLEAKRPRDDPDRVRPVKPARDRGGIRIDGMPAWFFALDGRLAGAPPVRRSAYEDPDVRVEVL